MRKTEAIFNNKSPHLLGVKRKYLPSLNIKPEILFQTWIDTEVQR